MSDILLVDFETRSRANLKQIGGRAYARHASTEVLCACLAAEDSAELEWEFIDLWRPREYPLGDPPDVAIAHNALGFDRFIWARLGWPAPRRWVDSAVLARRAGYASASLAMIGERYGVPKDKEGNALTVGLSRTRKDGSWLRDPESVRDRVLQYCRSDVELMSRIVSDLYHEFDFGAYPGGTWQAWEHRVYEVACAIEDRGVKFDREYAHRVIREYETRADEACAVAGVTPAQMRSNKTFCELSGAPNAQRGPLAARAEEPIVAARLACTSIVPGKLQAGLARVCPDGRLRDNTRYYGAHTGRWSGQGMQLQNLPRGGEIRGVLCS